MVFPLLYTIAKIQCHFGGINRSVQFKVFFGNENTFPLSSAIYSQILDIEGLLTRHQTTLFISTGIPFFLFKLRSTGIFIFPTSDSSTISEQRYRLLVKPSS